MEDKQLYLFGLKEAKKNIRRRRYTLVLPLDICILMGAILILLFVFIFSLGVEKGRKISYLALYLEKDKYPQKPLKRIERKTEGVKPILENKRKVKAERKKEAAEKGVIYVIQVASFIKENSAQKEAKQLRNKGYPVLVSKRGKYSVIFVGQFKNKKDAERYIGPLKKRYKDCFVRKL